MDYCKPLLELIQQLELEAIHFNGAGFGFGHLTDAFDNAARELARLRAERDEPK